MHVLNTGTTVIFDFPGHALHGKRCVVARIDEQFVLSPEDMDPVIGEVIFLSHPSFPEPFGIGRHRIGGTVENVMMRRLERQDDETQGELLL